MTITRGNIFEEEYVAARDCQYNWRFNHIVKQNQTSSEEY